MTLVKPVDLGFHCWLHLAACNLNPVTVASPPKPPILQWLVHDSLLWILLSYQMSTKKKTLVTKCCVAFLLFLNMTESPFYLAAVFIFLSKANVSHYLHFFINESQSPEVVGGFTWPKVCGHLLVERLIPKSWALIWSWSRFAVITASTLLGRRSTRFWNISSETC